LTGIVSQDSPISIQNFASHLYEKLFQPAVEIQPFYLKNEKVVAQFMNIYNQFAKLSLKDKQVLKVLFTICSIIGPASTPSVTK
jgi:hypothetical protein